MYYLLLINNLHLLHQYRYTNAISTNKLTNFNNQNTYSNYDIKINVRFYKLLHSTVQLSIVVSFTVCNNVFNNLFTVYYI